MPPGTASSSEQRQRRSVESTSSVDEFARRASSNCQARLARDRLRVRASLCGDGRAAWRDALVGLRVMQWVRAQRRLCVHMCARLSFDGFCERDHVDAYLCRCVMHRCIANVFFSRHYTGTCFFNQPIDLIVDYVCRGCTCLLQRQSGFPLSDLRVHATKGVVERRANLV